MTTPPYQFDDSDDATFQDLLDEHVLGSRNRLAGVKPSTVNFTVDCWATLDLQHFAFHAPGTDEVSRLSYIENGLQPALPDTNVSLVDINEYWSAITSLNSTEDVVNAAIGQCNKTDGFSVPALDFNSNCSAAADFWWHNVFNTTTPRQFTADPSWLPLFRSSLAEPYRNMSDLVVSSIYEKAREDNLTLPNVLPPPLQSALVIAAASCAPSACASLNYGGNADIAGTGVSQACRCLSVPSD